MKSPINRLGTRGLVAMVTTAVLVQLGLMLWGSNDQVLAAGSDASASQVGVRLEVAPTSAMTVTAIQSSPAALQVRTREPEFYEAELDQPDRKNLPQAPGARDLPQWPPAKPDEPGAGRFAPQTLGISFDGATGPTETGAFPPDCMGAVGPTQFVVFLNGRLRTFNKTTGVADGVLNIGSDAFFASVVTPPGVGEVSFTSDPNVRYDRLSNRWFITIIDVTLNSSTGAITRQNRVLIALTDAASNGIISGGTVFTFYQFQGDATLFTDYPSLGIDASALYIGGDMFTLAGVFNSTKGFVIPKTPLLSASAATVWAFAGLVPSSAGAGPFAPRGVDNYDPTNVGPTATGYFIGVDNATFGALMLRRVTNPGSTSVAPTISANISISTTLTTSFPVKVPHLGNSNGTAGRLDALDDRLYAAHLRNGRLWTAHNIGVINTGVASGSATRNAARWYEIQNLASTPAVVQAGTLYDNTLPNDANQRNYWIPTIMVSGQGHAALGCSIAGANERINAFTSGRLAGDALGTLRDGPGGSSLPGYTASTTAYNPSGNAGGTNGRRWGDYSFTSLDPNDDMTMWTIQEYCNGTNTYGVRAVKLVAPPPATPSTASPNTLNLGSSGVDIFVTGTSVAGSGFYDPGSGFPNRISATVSGTGVTVNSVTYMDPTHVILNVSVSPTATTGTRNITITNPDGQAATSPSLPGIVSIDVALPIQLVSFAGTFTNGTNVRLDWATASEIMNYGFEVEKSPENADFQVIPGSFIPGHGTTNEPQQYTYTDTSADGPVQYYRLKQIDLDGTTHYADPIMVSVTTSVGMKEPPTDFSLYQNYPNPFNPSTVIRYGLPTASVVKVEVFNTLGQRVSQLVNAQQEAGFHEITFETSGMTSGVYFCVLQAGQFRASRKLLLLR